MSEQEEESTIINNNGGTKVCLVLGGPLYNIVLTCRNSGFQDRVYIMMIQGQNQNQNQRE